MRAEVLSARIGGETLYCRRYEPGDRRRILPRDGFPPALDDENVVAWSIVRRIDDDVLAIAGFTVSEGVALLWACIGADLTRRQWTFARHCAAIVLEVTGEVVWAAVDPDQPSHRAFLESLGFRPDSVCRNERDAPCLVMERA